MKLQTTLDHVIELIGKGELESAIQELSHLLKHSKKLNEIVLQSARYHDIKKQIRLGTVDFENANVTKNQIRAALLDIIREVKESINRDPSFESAIEKEINNKRLIIKVTKLLVLGILLLSIIIMGFQQHDNIYACVKNKVTKFNSQDTTNLKILLLPFKMDENTQGGKVDFKGPLVERLNVIKSKEGLQIELLSLQKIKCLADDEELVTDEKPREIAESKNADLVVWGSYELAHDSNQNDRKSIRLRYALTKNFQVDRSKQEGDTEMQRIDELKQLRQGYLQEDIDYVLHWVQGMTAYEKGNFKLALHHFEEILNDSTEYKDLETYWRICEIYQDLGKINEALKYAEKAVKISEDNFNEDHPKRASSYNQMGVTLMLLGKYDLALEYINKAIEIREKLFDHNHLDIATSYNNLALVLIELGDFNEALKAQLLALEIQEQILNHNHHDIATSLNNLSLIYRGLGEYENALQTQLNAIKIREEIFNPLHPSIANSYNNLATVYMDMKEFQKALPAQLKAIEIQEKIMKADHPDLAQSYNNLAMIYQGLTEYEKALPVQLKAIEIYKKELGVNHPNVATCYSNLSVIYKNLGEPEESFQALLKALEIRKKVYPDHNHPDLGISYNSLAIYFRDLGDYEKAINYEIEAISIFQSFFGSDNPNTAFLQNNLATFYQNIEDYENAKSLSENALSIFREKLGEEHPNVALTLNCLAESLRGLNDIDLALEYHEEAIRIGKLKDMKDRLPYFYSNYSKTLLKKKAYDEALFFQQKSVSHFEKLFPNGHSELDKAKEILNELETKTENENDTIQDISSLH